MKILLTLIATLLLSSCASDGGFHTSTSFNGQSFSSFDMTNPKFYMDSEAPPPSDAASSMYGAPHYGIDGYCGYCRH
jgi:hypothetical protein